MQLRLLGPTTVIYLQHLYSSCSIYSCSDSPVIDLTVIAAPNVTRYVPSHLLGLRPTSCFFFSPLSPKPSPCWGDLPCLLTDNSDRKLLHVITLLKSQFTQPQQIILRWVPGVMETVFSTLRPASPALAKPRRSSVVAGEGGCPRTTSFPASLLRIFSSAPLLAPTHTLIFLSAFLHILVPSLLPLVSPPVSNKNSSVSPQADAVAR